MINKVSFSLTAGEIIVILGASGDGKTTLMKALAGYCLFNQVKYVTKINT
ncbi:MAG: ATP-binding cassette domain-containing protein [Crocinitomicaceae bacterium]|nr:ATP-binding cassette domain-containing protein [Crocinitomicaceae bacterium]